MPRRKGRRAVDPTDRSVLVTITLPGRQFDQYCAQAVQEAVSVPEIIRRELGQKQLKTPPHE